MIKRQKPGRARPFRISDHFILSITLNMSYQDTGCLEFCRFEVGGKERSKRKASRTELPQITDRTVPSYVIYIWSTLAFATILSDLKKSLLLLRQKQGPFLKLANIEDAKARMCWLQDWKEASSGDTGKRKSHARLNPGAVFPGTCNAGECTLSSTQSWGQRTSSPSVSLEITISKTSAYMKKPRVGYPFI